MIGEVSRTGKKGKKGFMVWCCKGGKKAQDPNPYLADKRGLFVNSVRERQNWGKRIGGVKRIVAQRMGAPDPHGKGVSLESE